MPNVFLIQLRLRSYIHGGATSVVRSSAALRVAGSRGSGRRGRRGEGSGGDGDRWKIGVRSSVS